MDTSGEPLVLKIKRAVEDAIGVPVQVQQHPDNTFGVALLPDASVIPPAID